MREPRPVPGAKTPLFDRLLDDGPDVRQPVAPRRAYDISSLRESVRGDLVRLLNTRSNLRGSVREMSRGTVLAYGIPDLAPVAPSSETQLASLARTIENIVVTFEPRLGNVRVLIQPDKRDPRAVIGMIYATLALGNIVEPVNFPLKLDGNVSKIEVEGGDTGA